MYGFDQFILDLEPSEAEYVMSLRPDQFYAWLDRKSEGMTVLYGPEDNSNILF